MLSDITIESDTKNNENLNTPANKFCDMYIKKGYLM